MELRFLSRFDPRKPPYGEWTSIPFAEALQQIGGAEALVAWDRDVTAQQQLFVPSRTWALADVSGGRVWISQTAGRCPVPIDFSRAWQYTRPTPDAMIGRWSPMTILDQVVYDVGIPTRCLTPFHDNDILFVGELVKYSAADLLEMRNLGKTTLRGIQQALAKRGLALGMDVGSWTAPPTALTWAEPPSGSYDVTFDCEVFEFSRSCNWHAQQCRIIRPPDGMGYAYAYRYGNFVSNWNDVARWDALLRCLNTWRFRNVRVVEGGLEVPPSRSRRGALGF